MSTEQTAFEGWAIVELMGHNTVAGFVSEQTIAGSAMLRVDVPQVDDDHPGFTKFYGGSALYGVTPTTEEVARHAAARLQVRPISPYVLPTPSRQLVDSMADDFDDGGYEASRDDYDDDDGNDDDSWKR